MQWDGRLYNCIYRVTHDLINSFVTFYFSTSLFILELNSKLRSIAPHIGKCTVWNMHCCGQFILCDRAKVHGCRQFILCAIAAWDLPTASESLQQERGRDTENSDSILCLSSSWEHSQLLKKVKGWRGDKKSGKSRQGDGNKQVKVCLIVSIFPTLWNWFNTCESCRLIVFHL